jgi:hypothetical protein
VHGAARPHKPDLEAGRYVEAVAPIRGALGREREVWDRRRDGVERGAERERQRHQRTLHVECGQPLAARDDVDAGHAGDERDQRPAHLEHELAAARRDQRDVAQELDGVAEALLGMQQDGLAGERLAAPLRLREIARRQVADAPARLVFFPAGREVAALEQHDPLARDRLGVVGLRRLGGAEFRERLVEPFEILQR